MAYPTNFKTRQFIVFLLIILLGCFFSGQSFLAVAVKEGKNIESLKAKIEERNKELDQLEKKSKVFEKQIRSTQVFGSSLKKEISKISNQEKSVKYSINITKKRLDLLSLELDEANLEINDLERRIDEDRRNIAELLRKIYEKDQGNFLELILAKGKLSEIFSEVQAVIDLETNLTKKLEETINNKKKIRDRKLKLENIIRSQKALKENLKTRISILASQKKLKKDLLIKTKSKEVNYKLLLKQIETRRIAIAKEIDDLEEALRGEVGASILSKGRILSWPAKGPITQRYGATKFAQTHYHSKFHNGIDIGIPIGTPIKSSAGGIVLAAGNQDKYCFKGAYGKFVVIKHYNGLTTLYAHLSFIKIKKGQRVKRGELIAYSGNTGYSTNPHLHFGVYDSEKFYMKTSRFCGPMPIGGSVNPINYLE